MRRSASELSIEWPPSMPISDAILPCLEDPLDVVGRQRQLERLRILPDHPMDDVDLLERRGDGGLSLELDRHVDGPELPADAAGLEPRDVGHDRRLRLPDVELVEVARRVVLARAPTGSRCGRR